MRSNTLKKIGYFDADVVTPEEILLAADLVPIRLLGDPTIELDRVNEHIPPTHCVWARNILEQVIKGFNGDIKDIKGVITAHGCDCTNREFDLWLENTNIDFLFFLNVPLKRNKTAQKFFIEDMKEMITQLEEKFNVKISTDKIREAIKLMNKIRKLLKEISEYRSKLILKGSDFHELVKMVQQQNKTEAIEILQNKLDDLKNNKSFTDKKLKKILLTGSVIDDTEIIRNLENLNFQVVVDDLCIGTRYFWNIVDEKDDPLQALANYHLNKPQYSTKFPSYKRFEFLKELAEKYDIDGVINITQKFCEPLLYSHPYFTKKFKELEIPYLFVEVEYNRESYKQLATRFEAFAEII